MRRNTMTTSISSTRLAIVLLLFVLALTSGCAELSKIFEPTKVDRIAYKPKCKDSWKGKTIFIDFDVTSRWYYEYASQLSYNIRDRLIEDVVEDGCFHVQDRVTGKAYMYKVGVGIADPLIKVNANVISHISATFRIKTYNHQNDLITAKTRSVEYKAPILVVAVNDSQAKLLQDYAYNVSIEIRKMVYESFK